MRYIPTFRRKKFGDKAKKVGLTAMAVITFLIPGASAGSINWTNLTAIIEGAASLFPAFLTLITEAVPILIILAVVGFIIGFFDKILGAIESATRMFK